MDSNSNSSDIIYLPKMELDMDIERNGFKNESRLHWNSKNTMKLIDTLEKECRELWDVRHALNKDRAARQIKLEYLAGLLGTTSEEISRKVHNLRTQFNNELRKIKRRQSSVGGADNSTAGGSGWEYFEALSFLMRMPPDPLDTMEAVNLELAEFQADEEVEFGIAARANSTLVSSPGSKGRGRGGPRKPPLRVAASAPPPLPPSANPLMWPEEPLPHLNPSCNATDECQIFGDFVASELRSLRSQESRKRLKRVIQKAILRIGEEEDVSMMTG